MALTAITTKDVKKKKRCKLEKVTIFILRDTGKRAQEAWTHWTIVKFSFEHSPVGFYSTDVKKVRATLD